MEIKREPVVIEYATLRLSTMQPDERYNTPAEYARVMDVIQGLVPYFTREYLTAYLARFVVHTEGATWGVCGVRSSTSIFVSKLKGSPNRNGLHKHELIEHFAPGSRGRRGTDIRLQGRTSDPFTLEGRPSSAAMGGVMRPPLDYSLRECRMAGVVLGVHLLLWTSHECFTPYFLSRVLL